MALKGNGQLLIKIKVPATTHFATPELRGYSIEPLSAASQEKVRLDSRGHASIWLLAKPKEHGDDQTPWDHAHSAARELRYAHYIEPDILHERPAPMSGQFDGGLNPHWPPYSAVSPGWHLEPGFTDFLKAHTVANGQGVKIAHLDTGYSPKHISKPKNLRPDLGFDYRSNKSDPVDPGDSAPGLFPGHGNCRL